MFRKKVFQVSCCLIIKVNNSYFHIDIYISVQINMFRLSEQEPLKHSRFHPDVPDVPDAVMV